MERGDRYGEARKPGQKGQGGEGKGREEEFKSVTSRLLGQARKPQEASKGTSFLIERSIIEKEFINQIGK